MIYTIEAAVYPAGSIDERQATANTICGEFLNGYRSANAFCTNNYATCQLAITLTPAVLFCGTLGQPPITTKEDYNPSVTCEEESTCCGSVLPSAQMLEFNNGDTVLYGCGENGGVFTAEAGKNIITLSSSTTATSTSENAQNSLAAASPSPTISGPKVSSAAPEMTAASSHSAASPARTSAASHSDASPAKTSVASHVGNNSSGLGTASELGSVLGAIFGAIAILVAIFYGTRTLRKWRPIHTNDKAQDYMYITPNPFQTNTSAAVVTGD